MASVFAPLTDGELRKTNYPKCSFVIKKRDGERLHAVQPRARGERLVRRLARQRGQVCAPSPGLDSAGDGREGEREIERHGEREKCLFLPRWRTAPRHQFVHRESFESVCTGDNATTTRECIFKFHCGSKMLCQ